MLLTQRWRRSLRPLQHFFWEDTREEFCLARLRVAAAPRRNEPATKQPWLMSLFVEEEWRPDRAPLCGAVPLARWPAYEGKMGQMCWEIDIFEATKRRSVVEATRANRPTQVPGTLGQSTQVPGTFGSRKTGNRLPKCLAPRKL